MKSIVKLILLVLLCLVSFTQAHRRCGTGFLKAHRVLSKPPDENVRYLSEDKWEPIRIHLDYSFIENNIGKFDKQDLIDLKEKIMPKTAEILQKLLNVRRIKSKLKFQASMCEQFPIPDKYEENGEGVDADLVIFVTIDDTGFFLQNRIEAAAIHCLQHADTRRPIAGYIQFKPQLGVYDQTAVDYMVWLALHEITHVLVFNDGLYQDYVDADLNPIGEDAVLEKRFEGGRKITYIKSPSVVERARNHFGCSTLTGVPLEYNGGPGTAGAHWSKKYMNTDYMIGDSYGENLYSEITLGLFNDSGWYRVDYSNANLFLWGKGEGCGFFGKKCIGANNQTDVSLITPFRREFCTNFNKEICSTSNIFRGRCAVKRFENDLPASDRYFSQADVGGVDPLTDHCPIVIEMKRNQNYYGGSCRVGNAVDISEYETIGPESACFLSSLKKVGISESNSNSDDQNQEYSRKAAKFRFLSKKSKIKEINKEITKGVSKDKASPEADKVNNKTEVKKEVKTEIKKEENKEEKKAEIKGPLDAKEEKSKQKDTNHKEENKLKKKSSTKVSNQTGTLIEVNESMFSKDSNFKAACIKFSCNNQGAIELHINSMVVRCADTGSTTIPGYKGEVVCPSREVLCDQKFMCKFGCVEKYSGGVNTK